MNTIEQNVADYLDSIGVTFKAEFFGEVVKEDWGGQTVKKYDAALQFYGRNNRMQKYHFPFYQGLGIKKEPTAAEVIYCLLSDLHLQGYSVQDYLDEFEGVSADDITVKRYREIGLLLENIEANSSCFKEVFTLEQIERLQELLEDY